ncbi:TPA: hypothetical protein ACH3X1_014741 [Trebouxia sp. C0004]
MAWHHILGSSGTDWTHPCVVFFGTLPDPSNATTEAFQLNDVSAWSPLIQSNDPLCTKCQFVTTGHVVGKLPHAGLLPQTQLRELASCVTLSEVLPTLRCSPEESDMTNQAGLQPGLIAIGIMVV